MSARRRAGHRRSELRSRRHRIVFGSILVVLVLGLGVVLYGVRELITLRQVPDYEGPGRAELVVQVEEGQTLSAIGRRLTERDVVASVRAFVRAAEEDPRIRAVQPGYYEMRTRMSGGAAVARMLDPQARVGQLDVRGGEQLDDVTLPDGTIVPGLFSELSEASCAMIAGASTCVSDEELRAVAAEADFAELGVPNWLADPIERVEPGRRLEGMVLPGHYDVRPGSSATELLEQVLETSVTRLLAGGMPDVAADTGYSPYEVLVIASIIEKEAISSDFAKVSRVIYNRLAEGMELQMDSTINYPLAEQQVRTSATDRARPGPYNTYLNKGLPVSPIGAPSAEAVTAAVNPEPGPWLYFVKCEEDGTSCFTTTMEEHDAAVRDAVERGVF